MARPLEDILNCGQFISPLIESIYQTANDSSIHAESSIVADEPIITLTPSSLPLSGLMTGGNPDGMGTESLNLDSSAFRPESDSFSHPSSRLNSGQTASGNPGGMSTESQNLDSSAARPESGPTQTTTSTTNDNDVNLPSHNVTTSTDQIQLNSTTAIESQARHALSLLDNGSMADDHPIHLSEELYVSKFSNRTTCDDLKHYISHNGGIDASKLNIIRLTKRDQDISLLSFVSFKIETDDTTAIQLLEPGFWPLNCDIKKFVNKKKKSPIIPRIANIQMSDSFFQQTRSSAQST